MLLLFALSVVVFRGLAPILKRLPCIMSATVHARVQPATPQHLHICSVVEPLARDEYAGVTSGGIPSALPARTHAGPHGPSSREHSLPEQRQRAGRGAQTRELVAPPPGAMSWPRQQGPEWAEETARRLEKGRGKGKAPPGRPRWEEAAAARGAEGGPLAHPGTGVEPLAHPSTAASAAADFAVVREDLALARADFEPQRFSFVVEGRPVQVIMLVYGTGGVNEHNEHVHVRACVDVFVLCCDVLVCLSVCVCA